MKLLLSLLLLTCSLSLTARQSETPGVQSIYYSGAGTRQTLIVGLGGSEGGNAWSSDRWKPVRDRFLEQGYHFLALGYFRCKGAPDTLNRISLNQVHDAIRKAAGMHKVIIIGGSRGGDLALLLAAHFPDINGVVAIVPSHVAFPGHTQHFTTSAWQYNNEELPFVPVNEAAVPFLMKGDLRGAFSAMLQDSLATEKAAIPVENINGPVLLLSATMDEICPSTYMCGKMMERLQAHRFRYPYEHIPVQGRHSAPLQEFDCIFRFLDQYCR
ncbi:alpha/beta hydrolase [Chitinophaga sp. Mgbs1]|uniref:Alpha/beta hydrolase n=1 Tax=Chitinophaga solisilvae TaxID=1233460 RepID=A0A433WD29_9BACT|nr:alpha/beta hydrolase [Chitinophaga solisilvae]